MHRVLGRRALAVVKVLLAAGANVHANDDDALRYASENGHAAVMALLASVPI